MFTEACFYVSALRRHLNLLEVKGKPPRLHSIPDLSLTSALFLRTHVHKAKRFTKQENKWSHRSRSDRVTSLL